MSNRRLRAGSQRGWLSGWLVLAGIALGLTMGWFLFLREPNPDREPVRPSPTGSADASPIFATLPPSAGEGSGSLPVVGSQAPGFTLKTLEGGELSLAQLRGDPVLINFWATWCPPCRLEMPDLVRAYETHRGEGLVVLGVNLTYLDTLSEVQAFVKEFRVTFPVLLDEDGSVTEDAYGLLGLPMSIFVDRGGVIRRIQIGVMTGTQIDEYVGEILDR